MSENIAARLRQHESILQISNAITAQLDITQLLSLVINAAVNLLAGNAGLIALRDESGQLHINAAAHIPNERWSAFLSLIEHYSNPNYTSVENDLQELRLLVDMPLRHVNALAMTYHGTHIGVILVFRAALNVAFSDEEQHSLAAFANQAAIAVTNARFFQSLVREKQHLAAIVEQSIDGVMILDARWRIVTFNHAMEQFTGWPREEANGRPCAEVVGIETNNGENLCRIDCPLQRQYVGSITQAEGWITSRDNRRRYIQSTYTIQRDSQEVFVGAIVNVRDITQQKIDTEMQNTFISVISHELKTPVSIIRGYAEMLARPDVTWQPAQIRDSLQIIIDEADRLTREINSLLDVSQMQLNTMQIETTTWPLRQLFEQICQRFAAKAQLQQIQLEIRIPDEMPDVYADRERIRVVCENLLTNAFKYSPNSGIIRIAARTDNGMAIVSVSDQGIGIPVDEQSKIFERFYRIDNRLRRETQGFGLGLFLAKVIIEAHKGQIWVESHANHGSRFFFSIPLAIARINGQSSPEYDEFIDLTKDINDD